MFDQTKAFFTPAVEFFKTGKAALLKGGDLSGFVAGTTKRAILVAAVGFASSASAAASVQFDRASASVPRVSNTVIERAAQPAVETAP